MRRLPILAGLLAALALSIPADAFSQERELRYLRESFYKLNYGDMVTFDQFFQEHAAPILRAMTEAGTIQGFSARSHDTGGEYNYRTTLRFFDWASIQPAIDEFFEKLTAAVPGGALADAQRMIDGHRDEIWEVQEINISEGVGPSPYLYNGSFRINPANMARWNELWETAWRAGFDAAVDAGQLNGYVTMTHAHGGDDNWKIIMLHADWDTMDDAFATMVATVGEDVLGELFSLMDGHHDNIWTTGIFGDDGN